MNKLLLRLCQVYMALVLLAASLMSGLSYSLPALALLLVMLFITVRTLPPGLNLVIAVAFVFLAPLVVAPSLHYLAPFPPAIIPIMAAIFTLPTLYLVDHHLRQNAQCTAVLIGGRTKRRYTTYVYRAIFVSTLVILLLAVILNNLVLLFTTAVFAVYLLVILVRVLLAVPPQPFAVPVAWKRVVAGATVESPLYVGSRASIVMHGLISPVDPWVRVAPQVFTLNKDRIKLNLTVTPPLAGPSHPELRVSALDSRGFIQVDQVVEPVELHVIPRARYAEWLAMRYVEQAGTGAGVRPAATLPPRAIMMPKRGIEYFNSRTYQPGDHLRDIDWKHTMKLSQLVIKEYVEAGEQAAIIAVNLSVAGAEEADKLAFNLITAALTLAQEGIPTALAAYNHQRVVLTMGITDPREILKQTLLLVKDIELAEFTQRSLELPDFGSLRRNIAQLKQAKSEPAQRLLGMLDFEYRAIEKAAKNHPATVALSLVAEHTPASAMIALVSQLNHDAEALLVTAEKLSRREFTIIRIDAIK